MKRARFLFAGLLAALAGCPSISHACSVCMGDPASKTAGAMNGAIFLMLGFVALMLAALATFAFYLFRRAQSPLPPYAEVAQMMNTPEDTK